MENFFQMMVILLMTISCELSALGETVPNPDYCRQGICQCVNRRDALCFTNSKSEIIPQDLHPDLERLELTYMSLNNSAVILHLTDLKNYVRLRTFSLHGNFSFIDADALQMFPNLTEFSLEDTQVTFLPNGLLRKNIKIEQIYFSRNLFTELPLNILDFSTNTAVRKFQFNHQANVILPCENNSLVLPEELYNLHKLNTLSLREVSFGNPNCSSVISKNFFHSVPGVVDLDISATSFLKGKEGALSTLKKLRYLDISALEPYKFCPSSAKPLFDILPTTIEVLHISYWQISHQLSDSCYITNKTVLQGIGSLKKLQNLHFRHSDGIFGWGLRNKVIPDLPHLYRLDLESCRLGMVEYGALDGYPSLNELTLTGNPVGPKNSRLLSMPAFTLRRLRLKSANLRSDVHFRYDASHILCDFPELEEIDITSNQLDRLPTFNDISVCDRKTSTFLSTIKAKSNRIESFIEPSLNNLDNLCLAFPYLRRLELDDNHLSSITGLELCSHLTELRLSQNFFRYSARTTTELVAVLTHLTKLTLIDLSSNNFEYIDELTLYKMPYLRKFFFNNNNLKSVGVNTFRGNPYIHRISLNFNAIQSIDPEVFEGLTHLSSLELTGNLITSLSTDVLNLFNSMGDLRINIGGNPFDCDCGTQNFQDWLRNTSNKIVGEKQVLETIFCSSQPNLRDSQPKLVHEYEIDSFHCYWENVIIIAGSTCLGFFITLLIALPCYKYRWYIRHIRLVWKAFISSLELVKLEQIWTFDAYVSFNADCEEDAAWVVQELVPEIESHDSQRAAYATPSSGLKHKNVDSTPNNYFIKSPLKLYLEQRDALGGTSRFTEREIALKKSKHVLIVVSNSYLRSPSCLAEADLSGLQMQGTEFYQPNRVILLIREELNEEIIKPPMSSLLLGKTLKVETSAKKKKAMWKELRAFLSKPLYTETKPKQDQQNSAEQDEENMLGNLLNDSPGEYAECTV